jgi:hypothetical protein
MIPTNKSEPNHLRIEETRHTQKSNENSSKKTQKSQKLQEGNQNHESFHTLGGHILYKAGEENLCLWCKNMRSCPKG